MFFSDRSTTVLLCSYIGSFIVPYTEFVLMFVLCVLFFFLCVCFFYSTDRFKAVVTALVLLFAVLWFILRGDLFMPYLLSFCSCAFFSPFSIAITSLGE